MIQWLSQAKFGKVIPGCVSLDFGRVNGGFGMSEVEETQTVSLPSFVQ